MEGEEARRREIRRGTGLGREALASGFFELDTGEGGQGVGGDAEDLIEAGDGEDGPDVLGDRAEADEAGAFLEAFLDAEELGEVGTVDVGDAAEVEHDVGDVVALGDALDDAGQLVGEGGLIGEIDDDDVVRPVGGHKGARGACEEYTGGLGRKFAEAV